MKTKEIQKAITEFDLISSILNLEDEILHEPLKDIVFKCNNETYYFDNIEEIKRYYINEICADNEYTDDIFRKDIILQDRVDEFIGTLYLNKISKNLIQVISNAITHDILIDNQ